MNQQKKYQFDLARALATASGPVQFLASDGHPLDEGRWTDPVTMLQHVADIKAVIISIPVPEGPPTRLDALGQVLETVRPVGEVRDLAGTEVITQTEFISRTYRGETVVVNGGYGPQEIKRLEDGYYTVDGEGHHLLQGLLEWLGSYHAEFGESVFWPG